MTDERDGLDQWLEAFNDEPGPAPDPRFVRNLRAGLIAQAERTNPMTATNLRALPAPNGRLVDRRTLLQLAAVLALVFGWVGTLAGGGPREITDRFGGYLRQKQEVPAETPSMYRGNVARTGVVDDIGPAEHPYVAWEVTPAEPGFNVVNATDMTILLAYEQGGRLVALDRSDGAERWKYDSECQFVETTPAIVDSVVYMAVTCRGEFASSVIALNEVDGTVRWRSNFQEEVRTSPLVVDSTLYVMTTDYPPALVAIDTADGSTLWQATIERVDSPEVAVPEEQRFGGVSGFSPAYGDGLIFVTSWDGLVHGIDIATGHIRWTFDTGANSISTPAFANGTIFFSYAGITMTDGKFGMAALDAETGVMLWNAESFVHVPYGGPLIAGDLVFYSISNGPGELKTLAWNRETGVRQVFEGVGGTAIIADGVLYLLDQRRGYVLALNADGGQYLWRAYVANLEVPDSTISEVRIRSEPVVQAGALIVASQATHLLVIESSPIDDTNASSPTPLAGYDLTNLPPCEAPEPVDWTTIEGEPTFSLITPREAEFRGQPAAIHPDDIPTGELVSTSALDGIESTIAAMKKCGDRPEQGDMSGFFSEDYFRRAWVRFHLENNPNQRLNNGLYGPVSANDSTKTFQLPDGRIARLTMMQFSGNLVVYVHNGERWVIDEVLEVTKTPEAIG